MGLVGRGDPGADDAVGRAGPAGPGAGRDIERAKPVPVAGPFLFTLTFAYFIAAQAPLKLPGAPFCAGFSVTGAGAIDRGAHAGHPASGGHKLLIAASGLCAFKLNLLSESVALVIWDHGSSGLPGCFLVATRFVAAIQSRRNGMNNKLLNCLVAGVLGTTLALASPALARGGGGGGGGGGMAAAWAAACMAAAGEAAWEAACMAVAAWEGACMAVAAWRRDACGRHGRRHALRRHERRHAFQRQQFRGRALCASRILAPDLQGSRSGTGTISVVASITASIALRSLAETSATPMTAVGAECGRDMDYSGSMSAATTATDSGC